VNLMTKAPECGLHHTTSAADEEAIL